MLPAKTQFDMFRPHEEGNYWRNAKAFNTYTDTNGMFVSYVVTFVAHTDIQWRCEYCHKFIIKNNILKLSEYGPGHNEAAKLSA